MGIVFIIVLFIVCVGGCYWLFIGVFDLFFPKKEIYKPPTVHNHYYHAEQHLHVTKDDLKGIIDTSRSQSQSE